MGNFHGARPPTGEAAVPIHAFDDQIYSIFGQELVILQKDPNDGRRTMAIKVEVGSFRMKVGIGDTDDDLAAATETDVSAGAGSIQFVVSDGIVYLSRNSHMTFQGEAGSDILNYWLLP